MHPVLFHIGSFYIGTYGLLMAMALVAGTFVALRLAARSDIASQAVMDVVFFGVLGGLAGGRVAHILVNFRLFLDDPLPLLFSRTGFVFLGGVVGAFLVVLLVVRKQRLEFWRLADALAPAVPLGHAFGRVGCFFAGCCYGRVADPDGPLGFLAVRFPCGVEIGDSVVGGQACFQHFGYSLTETHSLPVWPVQLFEAGGNLLIFVVLLLFWNRRRFYGQILLTYFALYSLLRFALEFLRGDPERGAVGPLSISQLLSLLFFAGALVLWPYLRRTRAIAIDSSVRPAPRKRPQTG